MNVLVTGATGNVGLIPYQTLRNSPQFENVIGISSKGDGDGIVKLDLMNAGENEISDLLRRNSIDAIIHFAAVIKMENDQQREFTSGGGIEKFLSNPYGKDKKYIVIGSVAEYGPQPEGAIIDENTPTNPINDYGRAKLAQTLLCKRYRDEGMDITVFRLLNVIAPNLTPRSFVGLVLDAMKKGSKGEMNINNKDIERDFLDMRDFTSLLIKVLFSQKKDFIYNVGRGGRGTTYGEFWDTSVSMVDEKNRPKLNILNGSEPLNHVIANVDKARHDFNWNSQEHTLQESIKWCLEENNIIEKQKV